MTLPSYEKIAVLHKKHAPSEDAFNLVFTHCQIVLDIAEQLIEASQLTVDRELVKVGCLLHDIGVYRMYLPDGTIDHAHYIQHGTQGYDLLQEEGFSEVICRIASHHTGVGLGKQEIIDEGLPLPPADYFAETPEEQLIMYADKFHTKSNPPKLMLPATYQEYIKKFNNSDQKIARFVEFQQQFGTPNLTPLSEKYGFEII